MSYGGNAFTIHLNEGIHWNEHKKLKQDLKKTAWRFVLKKVWNKGYIESQMDGN
jgi:hypothetical protein